MNRYSLMLVRNLNLRCPATVVPEVVLDDFCVQNEPILSYLSCSKERCELNVALERTAAKMQEVPIVIGDEVFKTEHVRFQVMPHCHSHKLAQFYFADTKLMQKAITVATENQRKWNRVPISDKLHIWDKAATLMSQVYRQELNAATMLGQAKTVMQAELDSAVELIDFTRMNAYFLKEATKYQPISVNEKVIKNTMRLRGIDGFVAAISPFNFTAIGGNLAYTPALMGNAVVWKPSHTALISSWVIFKIMREAGVPAGVVNFVPAEGKRFGENITSSPHLAGINFTGSEATFKTLWLEVSSNIMKYRNYPRLVGECGGKNFLFVHPSAEMESVVASSIRGAFEYSGQKCSATSRLYCPESIWPCLKERLCEEVNKLKVGDPTDYSTFLSAVIDHDAFTRIKKCIKYAFQSEKVEIVAGGYYNKTTGYYVHPTIIRVQDPFDKLMVEEIFGPILVVYVYPDEQVVETLDLVDQNTRFALTGSIFATDKKFLKQAYEELKMSCGNMYINDQSTGAIVGQQPFGGSRMSGTNDKAGGPFYILRWTSPQSVKETFVPDRNVLYPYMVDECLQANKTDNKT